MAINKTTISHSKKKVALLVGSICIHNIPEGFAVASAFAHSVGLGWLVTLSIAAQDAPEGLLVSTPLTCYGVECKRSIYLGILSGVIEGAFAILGYLFLDMLPNLTPVTLGFSSGAMLYVTLVELLPDAFKNNPRNAALSFVFGMLIALGIAAFLHF
jgi:ZIP family zinc transporter